MRSITKTTASAALTVQRFEDFDMDFSWTTTNDLINTAFDKKKLAQMDMGDTLELVLELARRLQKAVDEIDTLR